MAGDDERRPPERPEYKVYRSGGKPSPKRGKKAAPKDPEVPKKVRKEPPAEAAKPASGEPKPSPAADKPEPSGKPAPSGKPEYKVYRSRPRLMDRIRKPDVASLRGDKGDKGGKSGGGRADPDGGGGKRRWLRWILYAAAAWVVISFLGFAISAQIQKGKLPDSATQALSGGPVLLSGQNVLILGGDRRGQNQSGARGTEVAGPPRADSIMVVHAGLGSFRKLSIPRDSYAAIPDCGAQKINASLACNTNSNDGNPGSTIRTVEDFLGIDINHIVIVDFDGFAELINTIGGVTVDVPENKNVEKGPVVCGDVDGGRGQGGGVSLKLTPGNHTLQGQKALAFARLRHNDCDPSENDLDRAKRQQLLLNGIKGRLTSPLRLPYNFIKGPWIGWNAPKALISDMGGFTLPQFGLSSIFGGGKDTNVLLPSSDGPGGSLIIPQSECRKAVEKLLGGEPPRTPACSPG